MAVTGRTRWIIPTETQHAGRDGANRLVAIAASQDRRTFVVVDDSGATTDVAALAGGSETVAGLAHDVAARVLGHSECEVEY
ncbi:hypothetical protein G9444_6309 [Rhodococcus erythropolis]|uniref:Uncharacterized protein n=1 Tax=Rhodococcus erythropolis TaxID=1833 RepID=A0A6G9D383_RHOER|nr:hypothetical protein G9444_6309 [Rhodococcus erythropolis]